MMKSAGDLLQMSVFRGQASGVLVCVCVFVYVCVPYYCTSLGIKSKNTILCFFLVDVILFLGNISGKK